MILCLLYTLLVSKNYKYPYLIYTFGKSIPKYKSITETKPEKVNV